MDLFVSEALCVLSNKFGKIPRAKIVNTFADFYTEDEISDAKKAVLEIAETISPKLDELKKIKPRVGDGKIRRDIDDVLLIYTALDARKHKMPRFVAADLDRVPLFQEFETCKFNSLLTALDAKVTNIDLKLNNITDINNTTIANQASVLASLVEGHQGDPPSVTTGEQSSANSGQDGETSTGESTATEEKKAGWNVIVKGRPVAAELLMAKNKMPMTLSASPQPPQSQERRKIVGSRATTGLKINASESAQTANKSWHVFVGKLEQDADESNLKDYLEENGVTVTEVRKLKPSQEWQKKSSAFRVCVAIDCRDSIMNPDLWPENVIVRDWFFKPK